MWEDLWGTSGEFAIVGSAKSGGAAPKAGRSFATQDPNKVRIHETLTAKPSWVTGIQGSINLMYDPLAQIGLVGSFAAGFGVGYVVSAGADYIVGAMGVDSVFYAALVEWGLQYGIGEWAQNEWGKAIYQWGGTQDYVDLTNVAFRLGQTVGGLYENYLDAAVAVDQLIEDVQPQNWSYETWLSIGEYVSAHSNPATAFAYDYDLVGGEIGYAEGWWDDLWDFEWDDIEFGVEWGWKF
jgi:hypothetical protein